MELYTVAWDPEDHVDELCKIIEGSDVALVEKCLEEYVVDFIEPTGWRAVWRPDLLRNPPGALRLVYPNCPQEDCIVDVRNVCMDRLEAEITVVNSVVEMKRLLANKTSKKVPDDGTDNEMIADDAVFEKMEVDDKIKASETVKEILTRSVKKKERKPSCVIGEVKIQDMSIVQEKDLKSLKDESNVASHLNVPDTSIKSSKRKLLMDCQNENNETYVSGNSKENSRKAKDTIATSSDIPVETNEKVPLQPSKVNLTSSPEFAVPLPRDRPVWPWRGTVLTVRLWELTPLVHKDDDLLDMESTAEVIEQVRFFYRHIFYPWDPESEYCCYDRATIAERYQLHLQLEGAAPGLPAGVAAEMKRAVREAWGTYSLIQQVEESSGAGREGCELSPGTVQQLVMLHQRLEALQDRFRLLRDPVMRELSMPYRGHELSHLSSSLESTGGGGPALAQCKVWLVGRSCTLLELQKHMQDLPKLVEQYYPQCTPWSVCLASSLQAAMDASAAGDLVLLLPGVHQLRGMGGLGMGGGALHGVGEPVVVEGSPDTGDVMIHVSMDSSKRRSSDGESTSSSGGLSGLSMRNLTLKPQPDQLAVLVHSCGVTLDGVTIQGECDAGILLTRPTTATLDDGADDTDGNDGARCHVTSCRVSGCRRAGVEVRGVAELTMEGTIIEGCGLGLKLETPSKVQLTNCSITKCSDAGVQVLRDRLPVSSDDQLAALPDQQLLSSLLKEFTEVTLSRNTKDLLVVPAVTSD